MHKFRFVLFFVFVFNGINSISAELILHFDMEQTTSPFVDRVGGLEATAADFGHLYGLEGPAGFGLAAGLEDNGSWQLTVDDSAVFRELANDFTVAAWIYLDSDTLPVKVDTGPNPGLNRFFGDDIAWDADGWAMGVWEDGRVRFTKNGIVDLDTVDSFVELDTWTHVAAAVSSDDGVTIYVDGEAAENWFNVNDLNNGVGTNREDDLYGLGRTYGPTQGQWVGGSFDEIRVYDHVLSEDDVAELMIPVVDDPAARLDDGTLTDPAARADYVHDVLGTWLGDADLDGQFNSSDLVTVFTAGKYESGDAAVWAEGDWNGDSTFGSGDLVVAFTDGGYEAGSRAAIAAVPEPSSCILFGLGMLLVLKRRRR